MSLNKKTVDDINVKGKRVLVRCDFNVPLKDGKITDETRINAALPTIQKLINDGGKVILCSHLGKVKNGPNEGESLAPVAKSLSEKLGKEVVFVSDYNVTGEAATKAVNAMKEGDVVLLQNTRFRGAEETKNGEQFSKELADLADDYVCDAFGSSHRAHASVAGVTKFISAKGGSNVVGYLMEKEIAFLGNAVENPVRPFVAILGGAKVADKLNVISNLLEKCDTLIIGGGMAYTFLKAQGKEIGKSLVDDTKIDYCKEMMDKAAKLGKKLLLPVDTTVVSEFPNPIDAPVEVEYVSVDAIPADKEGVDNPVQTPLSFSQIKKSCSEFFLSKLLSLSSHTLIPTHIRESLLLFSEKILHGFPTEHCPQLILDLLKLIMCMAGNSVLSVPWTLICAVQALNDGHIRIDRTVYLI